MPPYSLPMGVTIREVLDRTPRGCRVRFDHSGSLAEAEFAEPPDEARRRIAYPTNVEFPNEAPAWMIFDHRTKQSVRIMSMLPDDPAPDWIPQAATVRELAERIGVARKVQPN